MLEKTQNMTTAFLKTSLHHHKTIKKETTRKTPDAIGSTLVVNRN